MAVAAILETFDVVTSGADGVVGVLVGLVALTRAPPVLTATPGGTDVVVDPVDVELMVDVAVEEAAAVFDGIDDAADLDLPVLRLVDELVDDDWLADAEEVESEDDGPDGSAHAIPWLVNRTEPTPSATTRPPIRPTYASPRTRQLYRLQRIDMPTIGRLAQLVTSMSIHLPVNISGVKQCDHPLRRGELPGTESATLGAGRSAIHQSGHCTHV